jgi:hypothetical protein
MNVEQQTFLRVFLHVSKWSDDENFRYDFLAHTSDFYEKKEILEEERAVFFTREYESLTDEEYQTFIGKKNILFCEIESSRTEDSFAQYVDNKFDILKYPFQELIKQIYSYQDYCFFNTVYETSQSINTVYDLVYKNYSSNWHEVSIKKCEGNIFDFRPSYKFIPDELCRRKIVTEKIEKLEPWNHPEFDKFLQDSSIGRTLES